MHGLRGLRALGRASIPLLLLGACAGVRMPAFDAILDSQVPPAPKPQEQTVQQRWLLPRGGIDLVFTLLVEVQPPTELQFVALDDFGSTLAQGDASAVTVTSRALPHGIAEKMRTFLVALYLPGDAHAVRVRETGDIGWHDLTRSSLRTATSLYVGGMRARFQPDGGTALDGSLTATLQTNASENSQ